LRWTSSIGNAIDFRFFHGRRIALIRRRADQLPEDRRDRGANHRLLPVHPAIRLSPDLDVRWPQLARAVLGGEVANNHIRFPQHEAVVFQGRHAPIGILGQIVGRGIATKRPANVGARIRQAQLFQAPMDLLHVDGVGASQQFDHDFVPRTFGSIALRCPDEILNYLPR
jgi:hypothetical protein